MNAGGAGDRHNFRVSARAGVHGDHRHDDADVPSIGQAVVGEEGIDIVFEIDIESDADEVGFEPTQDAIWRRSLYAALERTAILMRKVENDAIEFLAIDAIVFEA